MTSPLPPLIQQMLEPDFYPHPVQTPIELIQTHISFVLLTGDYAYKIKKPVNFGFVNFSNLSQRYHFCQEEVRLNQRTAPDLYRAVIPIIQQGEKFILDGDLSEQSPVVEYTIKMQEFPQNSLLISQFERGELSEKKLEKLGKELAKIHAQSQTNQEILQFGEPDKIKEAIEQNYRQTEPFIGQMQTAKQYEETRQFTDLFFQKKAQIFQQRIRDQKIRECHGDLHLKNIAFWQDKILIFDGIEFNESFRFVDLMYDVAFTVMDLESRQREDLANAFLNTYLEHTGDWEGVQVLPLYLSRQAYVRAKVNSLMFKDSTIESNVKEKLFNLASHYYHVAWEYTLPRAGKILLMSGVSGSGKSTIARQIARTYNYIHIRSDAVRKHLAGISLYQKGDHSLYTPEMTQKTYQRLLDLASLLASEGYGVILDAKYDQIHLRRPVIESSQTQNIPCKIIHCHAPIHLLKKRLEQRQGDITDATPELLETQLLNTESFTNSEQPFVISLDTTFPFNLQDLSIFS